MCPRITARPPHLIITIIKWFRTSRTCGELAAEKAKTPCRFCELPLPKGRNRARSYTLRSLSLKLSDTRVYEPQICELPLPKGRNRARSLFCTLVTGLRRSLGLKLSDTQVYGPYTRALLGTAPHSCEVVVLKLRTHTLPTLSPRDACLQHWQCRLAWKPRARSAQRACLEGLQGYLTHKKQRPPRTLQ